MMIRRPAGLFATLLLFLLAGLTASGCTQSRRRGEARDGGPVVVPGPDGGGDAGPAGPGTRELYVVSVLDVGQADPTGDPNIVPGFDLDHRVSDEADPQGCFKPDFFSPPPDNEPGVDNQMGPILASLGGSVDIGAELASAIESGSLLILIEVGDLHDRINDPAVTVELFEATAPGGVTLDASGRLAPGQTFAVVSSRGSGTGAVVNGRVAVDLGSLSFPFAFIAPTADVEVADAQLRFNLAAGDSLDTGVLGGGMGVDDTIAALVASTPDIPESLARSILEGQADLAPDAAGQCRTISTGFVFEAVTALRAAP